MKEIINLDQSSIIGKGTCRTVYSHPTDSNKCLKIQHRKNKENNFDIQYHKHLAQRKVMYRLWLFLNRNYKHDQQPMNIYIINLTHEAARRSFQENQLKTLGLDYEILKATSAGDIDADTYQKHYYDWQRPLRKAEVACYYSHRNIWRKIIADSQPALVLEDDALLSNSIPELLSALEKRTDIDLIDLEVFGRKKMSQKLARH